MGWIARKQTHAQNHPIQRGVYCTVLLLLLYGRPPNGPTGPRGDRSDIASAFERVRRYVTAIKFEKPKAIGS
jgi:hypothetical protein